MLSSLKERVFHIYTSTLSCQKVDTLSFLVRLGLPAFNIDHHEMLDAAITAEEIKAVIRAMWSGNSPGPDGLTAEFYKCFSDELTPLLLQMYNAAFERGVLPPTLSQALISLISKKGKESTDCESYLPISLISIDTKILSKILANYLSSVITVLINADQSSAKYRLLKEYLI